MCEVGGRLRFLAVRVIGRVVALVLTTLDALDPFGVRLVPLETPDKLIDVGRFDGSVFSVINEDAEV